MSLPVKVGILTSCCGSSRSSLPPVEQNKNTWRYLFFWNTEFQIRFLKNRWSDKNGFPNKEAPLILKLQGITVTTYTIILFDITCDRYAKLLLFRKFLFFPNKISRKEFDSPIWDGSLSNLLFRTSSQTKLTKSPKIEPGSSLLGFSNPSLTLMKRLTLAWKHSSFIS